MPAVKRIAFEQYCCVMCGRSLENFYADILSVTEYNMNIGGRVWPFFLYKAPWYQSSRKRVLKTMWLLLRERQSRNVSSRNSQDHNGYVAEHPAMKKVPA